MFLADISKHEGVLNYENFKLYLQVTASLSNADNSGLAWLVSCIRIEGKRLVISDKALNCFASKKNCVDFYA